MTTEILAIPDIIPKIRLAYSHTVKASLLPKVTNVEHAYKLLLASWDMERIELVEEFKVLLLNRAGRVLGISTLSSGSVVATIADPKQVYVTALLANAVSLIIAHNHPSGSLTPSVSDIELTRKMKAAGEFLELKLLDHIIVSLDGYYSFANEGTF